MLKYEAFACHTYQLTCQFEQLLQQCKAPRYAVVLEGTLSIDD